LQQIREYHGKKFKSCYSLRLERAVIYLGQECTFRKGKGIIICMGGDDSAKAQSDNMVLPISHGNETLILPWVEI
jgi:hypothetical protein